MTEEEIIKMLNAPYSCNCIGAQNGQPACPCKMRNIKIVNGRYVQTIDFGAAPTTGDSEV